MLDTSPFILVTNDLLNKLFIPSIQEIHSFAFYIVVFSRRCIVQIVTVFNMTMTNHLLIFRHFLKFQSNKSCPLKMLQRERIDVINRPKRGLCVFEPCSRIPCTHPLLRNFFSISSTHSSIVERLSSNQ